MIDNVLPTVNSGEPEVVLSTQKLSTVKIYSKKEVKKHSNSIVRLVILIVLLSALTISFFRIPYIGSYVDGFVFEYLFGLTKYLIYAWLYGILIALLFKWKWVYKLKKPAIIMAQIFFIIGCSLFFSALGTILFQDQVWNNILNNQPRFQKKLSVYHKQHFLPYLNSIKYVFNHNLTWFANTYITWTIGGSQPSYGFIITGGLIGEFLDSINEIILIALSLVLLLLSFIYFRSSCTDRASLFIRKIIVKMFGGGTEGIVMRGLSRDKNDVKIIAVDKTEIKNAASIQEQLTPPTSFLSDTSVDYYQLNKEYADEIRERIIKFIHSNNLNVEYIKTIVMPLYTELYFIAEDTLIIEEFLSKEVQFSKYVKITEFNVSYKGTELRIEFINKRLSKLSVKSILEENNILTNSNNSLVGHSYNNTSLFINFNQTPRLIIVGKKGSGASMLLSIILLTYAYLCDPNKFKIDIVSQQKNSAFKTFEGLPHIMSIKYIDSDNDTIASILHDYNAEIERRKELFKQLSTSSLEEYNEVCGNAGLEYLTTKLLVFNDYDEIIKNNYHYLLLLQSILTECPKYGIKIIIIATNVTSDILNENIYNNIDLKLILKLDSENESLQIFDNYRGNQLYGNGDGYIFTDPTISKLRFQTCYLNQSEANQMVKIISSFHKAKSLVEK